MSIVLPLLVLLLLTPPAVASAAEFTPIAADANVSGLAISADGSKLLLWTSSGGYQLWENGTFTPLSSLPGYPAGAVPVDMSADGQVIAGNAPVAPDDHTEGFLWSGGVTTYLDLDAAAGPIADALSGDGSTVVGRNAGQLVSWSGGVLTVLESLADIGFPGSLDSASVFDVSFDGSVAVGTNLWTTGACFQCNWAVRWDGADITKLDDLLAVPPVNPLQPELGEAISVSADGSFVAGSHRLASPPSQIFRLGPAGVDYPDNPDGTDDAGTLNAISPDGTRLVGRSRLQGGAGSAGVWDPVNDFRFLEDALLDDHGIVVPAGYQLLFAEVVSDGEPYTIVGTAIPPSGVGRELWLARLGSPPAVPLLGPLAAGGLAGLLALLGAVAFARR